MSLETGTYISDLVPTNPLATDAKSQGDDHIRLLKATIKATFPNVTGAVSVSHAQLNSVLDRGLRAGDAWSGSHDFTGASISVPTAPSGDADASAASTAFVDSYFAKKASPALTGVPTAPTAANGTNTTQIATTAFVVNTAFSSQLPAQTGNTGKFLQTDGTNAAWQNISNTAAAKSANYTVVAADRYKAFDLSSSATLSLAAAATLGDGFILHVRNAGTGRWAIDPNGSETIDQRASIYIYPGESYSVICDGANWRTFGRARMVLITSTSISGSPSNIDFETGFDDPEFAVFELDLAPTLSPAGTVQARVKKSGAYTATAYSNSASPLTSAIDLYQGTVAGLAGVIRIVGAAGANQLTQLVTVHTGPPGANAINGTAGQSTPAAIEGLRILTSTAFGGGAVKLYGVRG